MTRINGLLFQPGALGTKVILWKTAMTKNITASNVIVQTESNLTAKFKIPKKAKTWLYNVTVINPDTPWGMLVKGFKILT